MTFKELNIIEPILKSIEANNYSKPTDIQAQAIPYLLEGKDLLGCAQTGTGKTAAFAIPILQQLSLKPAPVKGSVRALIVTPTRELAIQIYDNFRTYGQNLPLNYAVIFGGVKQAKQVATLRNKPDVLIATPGRLLDLISQGLAKIDKTEILVLDEADRMLDMGFIHDVKKILSKVPQKKQTLLFSATMPTPIRKFANSILNKPQEVIVTPVSSTAETVKQEVYFVPKTEKVKLIRHLLAETTHPRTLVFTRTKHGADRLAKQLNKAEIKSAAIHGDKTQASRQRALDQFKNNDLKVLVATDIAARGIDIDDLSSVINYEIPNIPETYVHRIGRTGRAGTNGIAISFCDKEEETDLKNIQKLIKQTIPVKTLPLEIN